MGTFREEIQEFVEAATLPVTDTNSLPDRIHRVVREGFDVVGKVLNVNNDPAALLEARTEISAAIQLIVGKLLADKPVYRRIATSLLPFVVDPIIDQMLKFTGTADEFADSYVVPALTRWEDSLHRARLAISGT